MGAPHELVILHRRADEQAAKHLAEYLRVWHGVGAYCYTDTIPVWTSDPALPSDWKDDRNKTNHRQNWIFRKFEYYLFLIEGGESDPASGAWFAYECTHLDFDNEKAAETKFKNLTIGDRRFLASFSGAMAYDLKGKALNQQDGSEWQKANAHAMMLCKTDTISVREDTTPAADSINAIGDWVVCTLKLGHVSRRAIVVCADESDGTKLTPTCFTPADPDQYLWWDNGTPSQTPLTTLLSEWVWQSDGKPPHDVSELLKWYIYDPPGWFKAMHRTTRIARDACAQRAIEVLSRSDTHLCPPLAVFDYESMKNAGLGLALARVLGERSGRLRILSALLLPEMNPVGEDLPEHPALFFDRLKLQHADRAEGPTLVGSGLPGLRQWVIFSLHKPETGKTDGAPTSLPLKGGSR